MKHGLNTDLNKESRRQEGADLKLSLSSSCFPAFLINPYPYFIRVQSVAKYHL